MSVRLPLAFTAVPTKSPRGSKLAQLVPNHVFGNEYFDMVFAVVNHKRHADKFGDNRTGPRPGLDRLARAAALLTLYLGIELGVNIRSFFQRSTHNSR